LSLASSPPHLAGFVLAGGLSSRMGADKALQPLAGEPLIEHALGALRGAGLTAAIAGARSQLGQFAPVVQDIQPGSGPLGGVCAALASTGARRSVFVSVDMPLLPSSLLAYMAHHAQITQAAVILCSVNGFAQTFPAVVSHEALPSLCHELAAGRNGCFAAFQAAAARLGRALDILPIEMLAQTGSATHPAGLPAAFWLLNINRPADLVRAGQLLDRELRVS